MRPHLRNVTTTYPHKVSHIVCVSAIGVIIFQFFTLIYRMRVSAHRVTNLCRVARISSTYFRAKIWEKNKFIFHFERQIRDDEFKSSTNRIRSNTFLWTNKNIYDFFSFICSKASVSQKRFTRGYF